MLKNSFGPCLMAIVLLIGLPSAAVAFDSPANVEFFEARIRPLLIDHCYDCHGPDQASGGLRLDLKSGWERGGEGGPAVVPGDPLASLLIRAVSYEDRELQMPPSDAGGKLSDVQIADLIAWVRRGAVDPRTGDDFETEIDLAAAAHWAFQPIRVQEVPSDEHPIDYFVERALRHEQFMAVDDADMRTLVRRATYDLHGLPPTAEQLAVRPDEFPELVEQLLASPRYGERWARHWLDVARYSDAKDGVLMYGDARIRPFAYTYRDYVIRAFNDDKPFDEFIREQLAADQLSLSGDSPNLAAMGFLTLGRMFDNNRHDVIDDQIDVITRGFLGLAVSCARCHDHKFDPVPTADYYSLYGVLASSVEPIDRPRIAEVVGDGQAFEAEFSAKLKEVEQQQQNHYAAIMKTARSRTADYLVRVATTEPSIDETSIFFLSLLPEQLRPRITWRWRQLIAQRAYPDDPVFGPWHDLMKEPVLRPEVWQKNGVDPRIVSGLLAASPDTPEEVARAYGEIIRDVLATDENLRHQIAAIETQLNAIDSEALSLADVVGGGDGYGSGKRGHGIDPVTGEPSTDKTGFITVEQNDELVPVPSYRYVDGVFVPKEVEAVATSTGIRISGYRRSSGQTWDRFIFGPSSGGTSNMIDGVDYASGPNRMLGMHANKGITFDIEAMRAALDFSGALFRAQLGNGGAKEQSQLDFYVYLDGRLVLDHVNVRAQQEGIPIDVQIPETARFLTLVVTEGAQGISHDQAIFGNPEIVPQLTEQRRHRQRQRREQLQAKRQELQHRLDALQLAEDPLGALLVGQNSPVWFPEDDVYHYLSRQDKDAFRGLVNQLDAISVKHKSAADRAMVLVDSEVLCEPVIFHRGDPGQRGAPVPRRFLSVLSGEQRSEFPDGSGRLNLAEAIASPANPLTARVWVNRVWMHHFGEPLVENPSDFGLRTSQPRHLELLDYLAVFLIREEWKTKPLHRLIMTSKAWQRSSAIPRTADMQMQLEQDPSNGLIWHANRRRLDLEQMRDTVLMLSGQLDASMYGRPVMIADAANTRRTIYSFVERQNIPAVVQTFDFASADTSTPRRVTTTVPQQALFAMNSEFIAQAARLLAEQVSEQREPSAVVDQLFHAVYSRPPSVHEIRLAEEMVGPDFRERLAHVLLMSNELMFVD